ncbi:MAG: hypothetical protein P8Z49_05475 [Acidobacteriota bacterium]
MADKRDINWMVELIEEAEITEDNSETKYSHAVQVLTPIRLLKVVDDMVAANKKLTRPDIFRRALRLYLKMLELTDRLEVKPKKRRRRT